MIDLTGSYTALVTPFTREGAIDFDRLERNIQAQSLAGITGVVPCGTTGETPTLTHDEYEAVVRRTIKVARPLGLKVVAGAGANATPKAIELHRFVADAGADAALHVTPYYNKPSQEGLFRHYTAVADSCDLPIMLYNVPGRTGVMLRIETIERLAAHPSIVAIKEATGLLDLAEQIKVRTDLTLLSGDDPLTLSLATIGGEGVVSVLSNVWPDKVAALVDAFRASNWEEARTVHARILPLARALLTLDSNPIPVKTALKVLGQDTGVLRLPLCEPDRSVDTALSALLGVAAPAASAGSRAGARAGSSA